MSPTVQRIASDERLPNAADIVIVGSGILGVSAAYFLAKQGLSVALLDKGYVACEQSSRSWGWCRQQNRDERELPLSLVSMDLWDRFGPEIGKDVGFRRCGLSYVTYKRETMDAWTQWQMLAKDYGVDSRLMTRAEAVSRVPEGGQPWLGGVWSPTDGKGDPQIAAPVIAEGARALGATIHQECAARSLDISNGRIVGVHTEEGYIRTNAVLVAAGAWASRFLKPHGISFPQAGVRQTAVRTVPMESVGEAIYTPDFTITRRLDGSYTLAISGKANIEVTAQGLRYFREFAPQFAKRLKNVRLGVGASLLSGPESLPAWLGGDERIFERHRVLDPAPIGWLVKKTLENVAKVYPQFANVELAGSWGALVDCSPDAVPVVSRVDQVDGLAVAAGCSGHGFGLGPGLALLATQLLTGATPCVDPTPFRLSRLVDGSKLQIAAI